MLLPWPGTSGGSGGYSGTEQEHLVVFGSNAGLRDVIRLIDLKTGGISLYDAVSLMTALRADARVTGTAPLNIKAAAALLGTRLALFNCGDAPGAVNSVVVIRRNDFIEYLHRLHCATAAADGSPGSKEDAAARVLAPEYAVVHLELPLLNVPAPGGETHYGASVVGAATMTIRSKAKR
jgi:hypothetical protein